MNIKRIWYVIEHRANPSKIKNCCFLLKILKLLRFYLKKISTGGNIPHVTLSLQHFYVAPPPHKSASCATGYLLHNLNPFQRRTQGGDNKFLFTPMVLFIYFYLLSSIIIIFVIIIIT